MNPEYILLAIALAIFCFVAGYCFRWAQEGDRKKLRKAGSMQERMPSKSQIGGRTALQQHGHELLVSTTPAKSWPQTGTP